MSEPGQGRRSLLSPTRQARRGPLPALAVIACCGLIPASCANVLGLDDYQDAVAELCKCSHVFGWLPDCFGTLGGRLRSAGPETRSAWLAFYAEHCEGGCANAVQCFQQAPTCVAEGFGCQASEECCGYEVGGSIRCASTEICVSGSVGADAGPTGAAGAGGAAR